MIFRLFSRLIASVILCCIIIISITFFALGQVKSIREAAFLSGMQAWEENSGIRICAKHLYGFAPYQLSATDVEWIENGHTWIRAEKVHVTFNPLQLLRKNIVFTSIAIENPVIYPRKSSEQLPDYNAPTSDWSVILQGITVKNLSFSKELLDNTSNQNIQERLKNLAPIQADLSVVFPRNERTFTVDATLFSSNLIPSATSVSITAKRKIPEKNLEHLGWNVTSTIDVTEQKSGILASLFGWESSPLFSLSTQLQGPVQTFSNLFGSSIESPPIVGKAILQATPAKPLQEILGKTVDLGCSISLSGDYSTEFSNLTIDSKSAKIKGSMGWDAKGVFTPTNLQALIECSAIQTATSIKCQDLVQGELTLQGELSQPTVTFSVYNQSIEVAGSRLEQVQGIITTRFSENNASGSFSFEGEHFGTKGGGTALFSTPNYQEMLLDHIAITIPGFSLEGMIHVQQDRLINGHLTGKCDQVAGCFDRFDNVLDGNATFFLHIYPTTPSESLLTVQAFSMQTDVKNVRTLHSRAASLTASIEALGGTDPWQSPWTATVSVAAEKWRYHHLSLEKASLQTVIDENSTSWPITVDVIDGEQGQVAIQSKGNWFANSSSVQGSIDQLSATAFATNYSLENPVFFEWSTSKRHIDPVTLNIENTSTKESGLFFLEVDGTATDLSGTITLKNTPVELLAEIYPELPFGTTITGKGHFSSPNGVIEGRLSAVLDRFRILDFSKTLPDMRTHLSLHLEKERLFFSTETMLNNNKIIDFSLYFPASIKADSLAVITHKSSPVSGHLSLHTPVGNILPLITDDTNRLTGDLYADLFFTGSAKTPLITGAASLQNGSYLSLSTGSRFYDIQMQLEAKGSTMTLSHLIAKDVQGRTITGSGFMQLHEKDYPYQVFLQTNQATILDTENGSVTVAGDLTVKGSITNAEISGNLELVNGFLQIPKKIPSSIPQLNVQFIGDHTNLVAKPSLQPQAKFPMNLHIHTLIPSTLTVEGRGLEARWRGEVLLSGTNIDPLIQGKLEVIESQFEFGGKQLDITSGKLLFEGKPNDARVFVQGEVELVDLNVRAIVVLQGPIQSPQLRLYSSPELPEKEIASLILFNKHSAEITPLQGLQLAQTVNSLSGEDSGLDFLGSVRRTIGLDSLDIGALDHADGREYSIRVGKYIWKGVQVTVNQSTSSRHRTLGIEAELHPTIKLAGEIDEEAVSKLSLKWKKDY